MFMIGITTESGNEYNNNIIYSFSLLMPFNLLVFNS